MTKKTQRNPLLAPLIVTFIVAVAAIAMVLVVATRLAAFEKSMDSQIGNLLILNDRVRFCSDNQIRPCDDGPITAWNEAHPSEAFNLQIENAFNLKAQ